MESKSTQVLALLAGAIIVVTGVSLTEGQLITRSEAQLHNLDKFASKIAGTYYEEGLIGPDAVRSLHTLGADGTHVSSGRGCCTGDTVRQTSAHGVWERTGDRQITITTLVFGFQQPSESDPFAHAWTARVVAVLDFDEQFEIASEQLQTTLFGPENDPENTNNPTDPDAVPIFGPFEGSGTFYRLNPMG
jgi:hypothetical protein